MKKRIKLGNRIILALCATTLLIAITSSCTPKAYTARSSGINGKTGLHTVSKTQKQNNFEKAMRGGGDKGIFGIFK